MKNENLSNRHFIVEKLINIMNDKRITKVAFAELIGFPEPKWNKISNGKQLLNINELSNIARSLDMKEIDIITYPDIYVSEKEIPKAKKSVFIGFEVDADELATLGIADKVIKIIGK
jgi:DNA-binding Xre family transcriptional regulator